MPDSEGIGHEIERGLYAVASALESIAGSINALGVRDASTPMGAIEVLSKELKDGSKLLAEALSHGWK